MTGGFMLVLLGVITIALWESIRRKVTFDALPP